MRNILLTGGAGYIGSKVSYDLIDNNFKVIIVDDLSNSNKKLLPKKAIFKIPDNRKKITNYSSKAKWLIYNVCSSKPVKLKKFIEEIEKNIKTKIKFKNLKLQSGDVVKTHGSNKMTINNLKYVPKINYKIGIKRFVEWYREYYK